MRIRFWGVRGSVPTPQPENLRYGGNTSCVEVRAGEQIFIFDCGTGFVASVSNSVTNSTVARLQLTSLFRIFTGITSKAFHSLARFMTGRKIVFSFTPPNAHAVLSV